MVQKDQHSGVTHQDRAIAWLKVHPGPQHFKEIAAGAGVPPAQITSVLATARKRGTVQHFGSPRSGLWMFKTDTPPTTEVVPVEENGHSNGHQILPETLNFHLVGVLSDNRLVLEFKKTKDVFVAKRVDV